MVKNRYHTDVERGQINILYKNGLSQRQISKQPVSTGHLFNG